MNRLRRLRYTILRWLGRTKNTSPKGKKGLRLVQERDFSEPFWNETGDENHWKIGGAGLYHPHRKNVYYAAPEIRDGKGVFFVRWNPRIFWVYQYGAYHTFNYETSRIISMNNVHQKYGRFECRMILPKEKWCWPAFWLWGAPWPPEIDVIEAYGRDDAKTNNIQEINLHWGTQENHKQMRPWRINAGSQKWHEFAVEWRPDRIDFFTNGVLVFRFTDRKVLDRYFSQPMWVVVNNSVRNEDLDDPDYYSEFLVDYVRIYEFEK